MDKYYLNSLNNLFYTSSVSLISRYPKPVERDDETHYSRHYALSYFGTTGEKGVRKHDDYMKNYFVSQYGAIKDIDFTPIFENLKENSKEE